MKELSESLKSINVDDYGSYFTTFNNALIRYGLDENAARLDGKCVLKYYIKDDNNGEPQVNRQIIESSTEYAGDLTALFYGKADDDPIYKNYWNEYVRAGYKIPGSHNTEFRLVQSSRYLYGKGNFKSLIHSQLKNIADKIRYDKYEIGNTDIFLNCNYARVDGEDVIFLPPYKSPYLHIIRPLKLVMVHPWSGLQ